MTTLATKEFHSNISFLSSTKRSSSFISTSKKNEKTFLFFFLFFSSFLVSRDVSNKKKRQISTWLPVCSEQAHIGRQETPTILFSIASLSSISIISRINLLIATKRNEEKFLADEYQNDQITKQRNLSQYLICT